MNKKDINMSMAINNRYYQMVRQSWQNFECTVE